MIKFNDFQKNYSHKGFTNNNFEWISNTKLAMTGKHVSEDENNAVIKISGSHMIQTKYGYAVIMNDTEVVFVKDWQVWSTRNDEYIINFNRNFFNIKKWGQHDNFGSERTFNTFDDIVALAKEQEQFYQIEKTKHFIVN